MPDVRALACDVVLALDAPNVFAKDLLEAVRPTVVDPRDRALLTEIAYGTARRRGTIDALLANASRIPLAKMDPHVRAALRVGAYQLLFLDRVPSHAAVDAAVEYAKERTNPRLAGFVNGVLRGIARGIEGPARGAAGAEEDPRRDVPRGGASALRLRRPTFADPAVDLAGNWAARYAHPEWLVRRWLSRWPAENVRAILEAGVSRPNLVLRAPPARRDALIAELVAAGVPARTGEGDDAVTLDDGDATALSVVREGRAAVQDETAQRVVALLDVRPGDRVLDLCAAPGGKALQILERLEGRGELVACDASEEKVKALADLLAGRGARGEAVARARAVLVPTEGPLPFPLASFHAVLVDAPCSNTGVLRRRPEAKFRLRERDVANLAVRQAALIARAAPLVRPAGRLVYSTCSVEPEENGAVVAAALAALPSWGLADGFDVAPALEHDGGYSAVLTAPA